MPSEEPATVAADEAPVETGRLTLLLQALGRGDETVLGDLMPLVYAHLRRLARAQLMRERPGHTLDSVALVSEAFLRLQSDHAPAWESRAHFFGVAAGVMRRILVDQARRHCAEKRGGGERPVPLDEHARPAVGAGLAGHQIPLPAAASFESPEGLLAMDAALRELEAIDGEASRVVELRFFAGATEAEAAQAMRLSPATVRRRWAFAKAWLQKTLDPSAGSGI